jgi:hypothetical protein
MSASEAKAPSSDGVAGLYYQGSGRLSELRLDEDGGAHQVIHAHATEADRSGVYSMDGDVVTLILALNWTSDGTGERRAPATPDVSERSLTLLRVGGRRYLLASHEWREFVNAVNQGCEPRPTLAGSCWLDVVDETPGRIARQDVPDEWKPLLLEAPLSGVTIDSGAGYRSAWIDVGAREGVVPGLEFLMEGVPTHCAERDRLTDLVLEVIEVEAERSLLAVCHGTCIPDQLPEGFPVTTRLDHCVRGDRSALRLVEPGPEAPR